MRGLYLVLGWVMVGLAVIGALLPIMPSTTFLILAAWFFARSSPRLERWLLEHERFGPTLRAWNEHRAIARGAKIASLTGMAFGFALFWFTASPAPWLALLVAAFLALCAAYVMTRPEPPG